MRRSELWGWGLFVVCALVFVGASLRDGDPLMTVGSLLFLVACFFFLAPSVAGRSARRQPTPSEGASNGDDPSAQRHEEPV
jgi:hypothetical protein